MIDKTTFPLFQWLFNGCAPVTVRIHRAVDVRVPVDGLEESPHVLGVDVGVDPVAQVAYPALGAEGGAHGLHASVDVVLRK